MSGTKEEDFTDNFFEAYEKKETVLLLMYMVFSLGFFIILWLYSINKKLYNAGHSWPNPSWGMFVLFVLPIGWAINMLIFKILTQSNPQFRFLDVGGWLVITVLILKYLYDFCLLYGKVTKSNGLVWYFALYPGFLGIFILFLGIPWVIPLLFFTIISVPAMQDKLNIAFDKYDVNRRDYVYFSYGKKYS